MAILTCANGVEQLRGEACAFAYAGQEQAALQAADRIRELGEANNDEAILALSNWTYGNVYIILGQGRRSLTYYETAEQYYEKGEDNLELARLRVGMTGALNQLGLYEQAYQLAQQSWPVLAESDLEADCQRLAGLANNWGIACEFLGRYEEALHLYERKIALWRTFDGTAKGRFEIGRAHINLGVLKKRLNLLHEAEQELELGRQALSCGEANWLLDLARAEIHLAHLKIRQGVPSEQVAAAFARAHETLHDLPEQLMILSLFEAEWQFQSGNYPPDFFTRLMTLHNEYLQAGSSRAVIRIDILLAAYFVQQKNPEAAIHKYKMALKNARAFRDCELIFRAQYGLGRVLAQQGNYDAAQEAFEQGVTFLEQTKAGMVSSELRPFFLEDKRAIYYDLSTLHISQKQVGRAFHWVERARARELVEMISQYWSYTASFLTEDKSKTATPEDVCQSLPEDTLLLLYAFDDSNSWILPLTSEGFSEPRPLDFNVSPQEIERSLRWLHNLSQYPEPLIRRHKEMLIMSARQPLAAWYEQLLAPVQDLLQQYQRLIISPDGPLAHLPFQALYNSQAGRYLIETHEVSRTPSATAWLLGGKGQQTAEQTNGVVLAYADGVLHHTTKEVEAITAVYPNFSVYEGDETTLQLLQSEEVRSAEIIHMASHAVFRRDNPYFSYVALANGRLGMLDILNTRLKARLVVLSACETGRGLPRGGEYLGLAHAFLLANVRSVIATHWSVDDVATSRFMKIFYHGLANGRAPGDALRYAQLTFLSSSSSHLHHPYYWSPFFLLGVSS